MNKPRSTTSVLVSGRLPWINATLLGLCVLLVFAFILFLNRSVATGYAIRDWENAIIDLTQETERLDVAVRDAQSLDQVQKSIGMLGLVPAEAPTYVDASVPTVAMVGRQ
ncbi:hypothetical protein HYV73_03105 [Candidatus Uhrbacteria bacterium]|nr:hypothetical protein [Candidatus Uhrbacteria bacterium]